MTADIAVNGVGGIASKAPARKAPLRRAGKIRKTAAAKPAGIAAVKAAAKAPGKRKKAVPKFRRTSEILRGLLENNQEKSFTVRTILGSLGTSSFGTSLMAFSIPEVLPIPIPGISAIVAIPTAIISAQMAVGKREITLPKWLLKRSVPRKALAGAIRGILPILERLERSVKPRWKWMTSAPARKFLGLFILFLAILMGLPVPGTNMPLAIAVFVIALGLVERDGVMITAGFLIGLASIALVGGIFTGLMALFGRLFA